MSSSTPKRYQGRVTNWLSQKGFGFVESNELRVSCIFFSRDILDGDDVERGATVEFSVVPSKKKAGQYCAVAVLPLRQGRVLGQQTMAEQKVQLEKSSSAAITDLMKGMNLSSSTSTATPLHVDYASHLKRLMYFGFGDLSNFTRSRLQMSELLDGPLAYLHLPPTQLPLYSPPRKKFQVQGRYDSEGVELKPITHVTIAGALSYAAQHAQQQISDDTSSDAEKKQEKEKDGESESGSKSDAASAASSSQALKQALQGYDFISTRKVIKAIMSTAAEGGYIVYAYKVSADGPIVLDRCKHYGEQRHTVGAQFEARVKETEDDRFSSVYQLLSSRVGEYKLLLTGELDAVMRVKKQPPADCGSGSGSQQAKEQEQGAEEEDDDDDDETEDKYELVPIEITTAPAGGGLSSAGADPVRLLDRWVQSYLAGVSSIVEGQYIKPSSVEDPTTFQPQDILTLPLNKLNIPTVSKERVFQRLHALLSTLAPLVQYGPIYRVVVLGSSATVGELSREHTAATLPAIREGYAHAADIKQIISIIANSTASAK